MKKLFALTLAALLALSLLMPIAAAELDPTQDVQLRFAWWGSQTRHDRTQQIVDLYMQRHPNVKIDVEFYDWGSYWDKLAVQGAGGTLPDLIQMSISYIVQYYEGGLLLNLEPYVATGALDLNDIFPALLAQGRLGENQDLYAMNLGTNALMAMYDPAVAEQAGIEIKEPYTYDDLMAWGQKVKEATGIFTPVYTNQPGYMMRSQGSHLYKQDGSGQLGFDDPELMAYFNDLHIKALDLGITLPPEIAAERADSIDDSFFAVGEEWITYTWSNIASAQVNAAGRPLKSLTYPLVPGKENEKPLWYSTSQQICASASTKYPDWAVDFIDFMISDVEANQILMAERGMPVNSKVSQALQPLFDEPQRIAAEYLDRIEPYVSVIDMTDPAWNGEVIALLEDATEQINFKVVSPLDGIKNFMAEADKLIQSKQ